MNSLPAVESHLFPDGGWCPNNPNLPLLIYRKAFQGTGEDLARRIETIFLANAWPPAWRYTIYDYAHYHSTSHEVIGIYRGWAQVCFGDAVGKSFELHVGDVVLIPAGVSHQRLTSSPDFHGVGAYPKGCEVDELRPNHPGRPAADKRIRKLGIPTCDPVQGEVGPLLDHWKSLE